MTWRQEFSQRGRIHPVILAHPASIEASSGPAKISRISARARRALRCSAQLSSVKIFSFAKDSRGAPCPTNGVYWSVSHTQGCSAGVVADQAVGIDIEKIGDVSARLRQRAVPELEQNLFPKNDSQLFWRCWTAKEAVLKATGVGLAGLDRCRITDIIDGQTVRLEFDGIDWLAVTCHVVGTWHEQRPEYVVAVAGGAADVAWHVYHQ